jgi:hypothetical protein
MRPDQYRVSHWARYLGQIGGTLIILAWVPSNLGKTAALLVWWALTFGRPAPAEILLFFIACAFFSVMNILALRQGIFSFRNPDLLRMPAYEFFMWGFYLLHAVRALAGPTPRPSRAAWALAVLYALAFATIPDPRMLLIVTGILLILGLARFHQAHDFAYAGYMVLLGALVEYTGVYSGQWAYPGDPPGGVPLWFVTLWGGVGLFLRRLVLPILARNRQNMRPGMDGDLSP